jgi:hypothetical protein
MVTSRVLGLCGLFAPYAVVMTNNTGKTLCCNVFRRIAVLVDVYLKLLELSMVRAECGLART